jgi:hypothetical protein
MSRGYPVRVTAIFIALGAALTGCAGASPRNSPGALPHSFTGGLIDTQTQTPWSEGGLTFSGYHTTFTFTKLVFGNGKQGPYTLQSGEVGVESSKVLEYLTNPGTTGTCTATFQFADIGTPDGDATLTGNIGGLSRTIGGAPRSAGGYGATVELGVILPGQITQASGCGPNNEGTAHQFGEPPKITISITATGEINSAGIFTIDSNKTVPVAGGASQTDNVTGTLQGS